MKKKLYIILPILAIVFILSTAAVCNFGQTQSSKASDQALKEEELRKEEDALRKEEERIKEEQRLEEEALKREESKDNSNGDGESAKNEDNTNNVTTKKNEAPTVSLKICEGPTYSKADGVCYYRIEATVSGTPYPDIKFSRGDSNGAWGDTKAQINLKNGETYTLLVTVTNSEGKATDSIKLDWGCNNPNHNPIITDISLPASDLYIFEEYEISATATDSDNDLLTYKWSADGGTLNNPNINPVKWEAPGVPGTYHITVEASDGKGGIAKKTKEIKVEELIIISGAPPQVNDIVIADSPLYTNTRYYVYGDVSDPDNDLFSFNFNASSGVLSNQSANIIYWTTPANAGDYTISLLVYDKEGNKGSLTVSFTVENK